jgi:phosphoenolpyruvate carboxylase
MDGQPSSAIGLIEEPRAGTAGVSPAPGESLAEALNQLRKRLAVDPFANPIRLLALEVSASFDRRTSSLEELSTVVGRLTAEAFADRAARLATYLGVIDPAANELAVRDILWRRAHGGDFEQFRALVEGVLFGVVFTAHPAFTVRHELALTLGELGTGQTRDGKALDEGERARRMALVAGAAHGPESPLTLDVEHAWSVEALRQCHAALEKIHRVVFRIARERWPEQWTRLTPRLISLASWVGYDQDGRSDLTWTGAIGKRLEDKQAALERHLASVKELQRGYGQDFRDQLAPLEKTLAVASATVAEQLLLLARCSGDPASTARFARAMVSGREHALVRVGALVALIEAAMAAAPDDAAREHLLVMRASLRTHGLGLARIHVRLNSSQLHNAIRRQIGLDTGPNDPANRRSYFNTVNDLLDRARPVKISFGSLMEEWASAKRLMMTVAQIIKLIDCEMPVRFLIAETETGFTLLTALYYARLFGIEEHVEISPLFETAEAFERGHHVVEDALRSRHYRDYLKRQGKLAIQFGYSDSGRFIGQMAATFRIEHLRLRIAELLQNQGLGGLEVILFNTHGESIGRGGHPLSLADRIRYVAPPMNRAEFHRRGIAVREEQSFQGGDGYLAFFTPAGALAALRQIISFALDADAEADGDPIYASPDYAAEFFTIVQQEFAGLVADPDYAALLGLFGTHLLYKTGSRPEARESEGWAGPGPLEHPSQVRAIPNNAILQQLGFLANTLYGVGRAVTKDHELFGTMLGRSPRFRRALELVAAALEASDLDVTRAYVDTVDPRMWLTLSARVRSPRRAKTMRELAEVVEEFNQHDGLGRVLRRLQADYQQLAMVMKPAATKRRERLLLLHAIRLGLIYRLSTLAVEIPGFGPQHGVTRREIQSRIIGLDVPSAVERLTEIFPRPDNADLASQDFGEDASYRGEPQLSYALDHAALFNPMLRLYDLARQISTAIAYELNAIG